MNGTTKHSLKSDFTSYGGPEFLFVLLRIPQYGDATFLHEVQALARVRHKNLVAFRGSCIASLGEGRLTGYQPIIVLDYIRNGSLQNHLFNNNKTLTWPQRHQT